MKGLYTVKSKALGKFYIGSSNNIHRRWLGHKRELLKGSHRNKHLQATVDEYSLDDLEFSVLLLCDEEKLVFYEQRLLDFHCKRDWGLLFNISPQADEPSGMLGRKHSEEAKQKISRSHQGKRFSMEARNNMSLAKKGVPRPAARKLTAQQVSQIREEYPGYFAYGERRRMAKRFGISPTLLFSIVNGRAYIRGDYAAA